MKNKRKMIIVLLIIVLIVLLSFIYVKNKNKEESEEIGVYTQILENGTKLNNSDKLVETKKFGNYEMSNIRLTSAKEGEVSLLADVKNVSNAKADVTLVSIVFVDKDETEIATVTGIINEIESGETTEFSVNSILDVIDAYDFKIEILE